jgi:LAO/AO transport system kinase
MALARLLTAVERGDGQAVESAFALPVDQSGQVVGVTGSPGAGKSTLIDAVVATLRAVDERVGVLAVDPSSPYSGGALLGDRIRMMRHVGDHGVFIRSLANRGHLGGLSVAMPSAVRAVGACGFTTVLIETVGVGQAEVEVVRQADTTVVVTTPGMGDAVQSGKAGVLEIANVLVVNKADREGATETARDLRDMLRWAPTPAGGWRVPVVTTRADTGEGVEELVEVVRSHRSHLEDSGELARGRAARSVAEFHAYARARVLDRLDRSLAADTGRALTEAVADGTLTPAAAADRLVAGDGRPQG